MKYDDQNQTLTIELKNHVDSSNAPELEKSIQQALQNRAVQKVIVDCRYLTYISSAGLRVILRLKKSIPDTVAVNVTAEVYEIFDMTGFCEMMEIQKAYRTVSIEGAEMIGKGGNGKVYRIDADTIVKVYNNSDALQDIQRERELARTAFVLGVPTAISYDVVQIEGGGYGSVFELLNAESLAQILARGEKEIDEVAKISADLLHQIHQTVVKKDSMPDMKEIALNWSNFLKPYLPEDSYNKLTQLIQEVPEDYHLIHGDYHLNNVMRQNDEYLLIDMDTMSYGHPVFELASIYNSYCGYSEIDTSMSMRFFGISHEMAVQFWDRFLRAYLGDQDESRIREIEQKAKLIGYVRIMRRSIRRRGFDDELGKKEIENCRKQIDLLLKEVDQLAF